MQHSAEIIPRLFVWSENEARNKATSKLQKSKDQECTAAIWPLTHKNNKKSSVKSFRRDDQAIKHIFWLIKNLNLSCKASTGDLEVTTPCLSFHNTNGFQYVTDTESHWCWGKERVWFARLDYIPEKHSRQQADYTPSCVRGRAQLPILFPGWIECGHENNVLTIIHISGR